MDNNNMYNMTESNQQPPQYQDNMPQQEGSQGLAIASMVCGILSILLCCWWVGSIILSIVAVVLGIISMTKKWPGKGMAIAGIVTGGFGLVLTILFVVFATSFAALEALIG